MSAGAIASTARRATRADAAPLAAMLARAFDDDPVACWAFRPPRQRPRALARFMRMRLETLLAGEEVWMTEGGECAALWAPPGAWRTTVAEDAALMRCFAHPRLAWRAPLVAGGFLWLEQGHPRSPEHLYLAVLGTDPSHQGAGLGSALLRRMLDECDRDGVPAFLESSKRRNVDFYARHGFRVTGEVRLPLGPPMWRMWRDPA